MPIVLIETLVSPRITKRVLTERRGRADISIEPVVTPLHLYRRLRRDHRGQDLIEYAVIAAFVALVAVVGATTLGNTVSALYHATTHNVDHGANFSSNGSTSTSGADCNKDNKSSTDPTPSKPGSTDVASTTSACK
jgi:Flp pilus assembly pilin Flp